MLIFEKTKQKDMKNLKLTLEQKVEARLLKGGFNIDTVKSMMSEHFSYAASKYNGVAKIADVVSTLS